MYKFPFYLLGFVYYMMSHDIRDMTMSTANVNTACNHAHINAVTDKSRRSKAPDTRDGVLADGVMTLEGTAVRGSGH